MNDFFKNFDTKLAKISPEQQKLYYELEYNNRRLRDKISETSDIEEKNKLQQELKENTQKFQKLNNVTSQPNRNNFFADIANTTKNNMKIIDKADDNGFSQSLRETLQSLKASNRNISTLSKSQQNILMKASVYAQLASVKTKSPIDDL